MSGVTISAASSGYFPFLTIKLFHSVKFFNMNGLYYKAFCSSFKN